MFLFKYCRCIRRIIFNSIVKPTVNEKGEKEIDSITTSQALQIAGRAGRYGSSFTQGEVTTMHRDDLVKLKEILSDSVRPVKVRGLVPSLYRCALELFYSDPKLFFLVPVYKLVIKMDHVMLHDFVHMSHLEECSVSFILKLLF